ncbi:hypothetical protein D3C81_2055460 [compost metagenome]
MTVRTLLKSYTRLKDDAEKLPLQTDDTLKTIGLLLYAQGGEIRVPDYIAFNYDHRDLVITSFYDPTTREFVLRLKSKHLND